MIKIRLVRLGAKKRPFYRVVVMDERKKRNGEYLELLGTYNPLTEPKEINLKQDRVDEWVKKGAQLSVGFLRIIGKAPQRHLRKPKKEKVLSAPPPPTEEAHQAPQEEPGEQAEPVAEQSAEPEAQPNEEVK